MKSKLHSVNGEGMRQNFDPYEDCGYGPQNNELKIYWAQAAVSLIVQLVYAYDVLRNNGNNVDKLLSEVGTKLDQIRIQLVETNYLLTTILDMVREIPMIVRGEMEDVQIRQTLGFADGSVEIIQEATASQGLILQDPQRLQQELDNLRRFVAGIRNLSGMTGLLVAAPYLSAWLSGATAYQKAMLKSKPDWIITSPWETPFWKTMNTLIKGVFTVMEHADLGYETDTIKKFPKHKKELVVRGAEFVAAAPASPGYVYKFTCPDLSSERLQSKAPAPPGQQRVWKDVLPTQPEHADAIAALKIVMTARKEVSAFYLAVPDVYAKKTEIMSVFDEPFDYWSITT